MWELRGQFKVESEEQRETGLTRSKELCVPLTFFLASCFPNQAVRYAVSQAHHFPDS